MELILIYFSAVSGCIIPVVYNDIAQSPDGSVTIGGSQGEGRDIEAVLLICKRKNNVLNCKSSRPGEIASSD